MLQLSSFLLGIFVALNFILLWIWFLRPQYICDFMKWYFVKKAGLSAKYIDVNGVNIHYATKGTPHPRKLTFFFIHGFTSDMAAWGGIVERMPVNSHFVVLDMPGHGSSGLPNDTEWFGLVPVAHRLREFLSAIGLAHQKLHIAGHSLGGAVAATYATCFPEQVDLVTLISPLGYCGNANEFYYRSKKGDFSWMLPTNVEDYEAFTRTAVYNASFLPRQIIYGELLGRLTRQNLYWRVMAHQVETDPDIEVVFHHVDNIKQPVSIIWGRDDEILPVENCDALKARIPNCARVDIIEECGHCVTFEHPEKVATCLAAFHQDYSSLS